MLTTIVDHLAFSTITTWLVSSRSDRCCGVVVGVKRGFGLYACCIKGLDRVHKFAWSRLRVVVFKQQTGRSGRYQSATDGCAVADLPLDNSRRASSQFCECSA